MVTRAAASRAISASGGTLAMKWKSSVRVVSAKTSSLIREYP
jgi:hypothetical protein